MTSTDGARAWREEHASELALRLWAPTREGLFAKAGEELARLMLGDDMPGRETVAADVVVEAPDDAALLVAWLQELIYRAEIDRAVFTRFELQFAGPHRLRARIHGRATAAFRNPVKAATYHRLSAAPAPEGGWGGHVVLDV